MRIKNHILLLLAISLTNFAYTQNDIVYNLNKSEEWLDKNLDSSIFFSDLAYKKALEIKDDVWISKCAARLSRNYEFVGNYSKALYYAKIALVKAEQLKNDSLLFAAHNACGIQNEFLGNWKTSKYHYDKSLLYAYKNNSISKVSSAFNNLGLLNYTMGRFGIAYDYFNKHLTLSMFEKNLTNVSIAYNNLALLFQALDNKRVALNYYFKTLAIDEKIKNDRYYSATLNNIATVYIDLQIHDSAFLYVKKSLAYKKTLKDIYGEMLCYQNLGVIHSNMGKNDSALYYFFKAKKLNENIKDISSTIETNNAIGNLYIKEKKYTDAILYLKIAEANLNDGTYHKSNEIYKYLARAYEGIGDIMNTVKYLKLYISSIDTLYKNENVKKIQEKELLEEIERQKYINNLEQQHREQILRERQEKTFFINIVIVCCGIGVLIFALLMYRNYKIKKKANNILTERNDIITKQNSEITLQKKIIEEKNKDITDSIHYAKRLQDAMLPDEINFKRIFANNFFILFLPKDIVSGDFYWLAEKENGVLLAVADCTGHGVPGGFMSIVANNALNRSIKEFGLSKPNEILEKVNTLIEDSFSNSSENNEVRDGMDISLCLLKKEGEKNTLYYSAANRPLWIIRNNALIEIKGDNQPIGKYEGRKPFTQHEIILQKNDVIYLSSDGYADQFGGNEIKKFKTANFKRLLTGICNENMNEQKNIILQTHHLWKKDLEQIDDICVIGIRI